MHRERAAAFRLTALTVDAGVLTLTFLAVLWLRFWLREAYTLDLFPAVHVLQDINVDDYTPLIPLMLPLWLIALHLQGTYDNLRRMRTDVLLIRIARASALALLLLIAGLFAIRETDVSRTLLAGFSFVSVLTVFTGRMGLRSLMRRRFADADTWNIVLVGASKQAGYFIETLRHHPEWGLRVLGVVRPDEGPANDEEPFPGLPVLGGLSDLPSLLEHQPVHQVLMSGHAWDTATLRGIADSCEELGVRLSIDANFLGLSVARAELDDFDGWSVLSFNSTPTNAEALAIKRIVDVAVASSLLVALSPVMLLAAALVRLEDGGPALFSHERCGLYGRPFEMWKFRSMVLDADRLKPALAGQNEVDGPAFKMLADPRITRTGRWLRRTSIDELPQLWNVLRGEMSLVGPRPPIPNEVEEYQRWQMRRLSMKPGLTCIWQVSGRSNLDFDTWMRLDLQYIDNWSLFLDFRLMLKTVPAVLSGNGAR